jgi:hypothetical protein
MVKLLARYVTTARRLLRYRICLQSKKVMIKLDLVSVENFVVVDTLFQLLKYRVESSIDIDLASTPFKFLDFRML